MNKNDNGTGSGRGGARPGSGRPACGHVAVKLLMAPEDAERLKASARARGLTLGAFVNLLLRG